MNNKKYEELLRKRKYHQLQAELYGKKIAQFELEKEKEQIQELCKSVDKRIEKKEKRKEINRAKKRQKTKEKYEYLFSKEQIQKYVLLEGLPEGDWIG